MANEVRPDPGTGESVDAKLFFPPEIVGLMGKKKLIDFISKHLTPPTCWESQNKAVILFFLWSHQIFDLLGWSPELCLISEIANNNPA